MFGETWIPAPTSISCYFGLTFRTPQPQVYVLTLGADSRTITLCPRKPKVRAAATPPSPTAVSNGAINPMDSVRMHTPTVQELSASWSRTYQCVTYPAIITSRGTLARVSPMMNKPEHLNRVQHVGIRISKGQSDITQQ